MPFSHTITDVVDVATGRSHRADPVLPTTGGPAGNARITAWTGLLLLVLIAVELVTLLDVRGLISWHIVVGTLLVPVALLKTATTTWRIGRYYSGHQPYRSAGPPPTLLRILGPLVVITTLAELGSGLALIALGPESSRRVLFTALGQRIDTLTLHQALFFAFAAATGLHILGRTVPAVTQVVGRLQHAGATRSRVPGGSGRVAALLLTLVAAAVTAALILGASSGWKDDRGDHFPGRPGVGASERP
jgi:hypothetical protein